MAVSEYMMNKKTGVVFKRTPQLTRHDDMVPCDPPKPPENASVEEAKVEAPTPASEAAARLEAIIAAIPALSPEDFTTAGVPNATKLTTVLGWAANPVTKEERDLAYAEHQVRINAA